MSLRLASASSIRATMLANAGVDFVIAPSRLDEAPIQDSHVGDGASLALALAGAKALASEFESDWVIGSDSVVEVDGRRFAKPHDRDEAHRHLRFFSGRTLILASAVALAHRGQVDWSTADTARLHVRHLSDAFIADYLDQEWPDVGYCVGVFRMEGRGVTLFDAIDGNHFTILGMPLLPLLGALRERGLMAS